MTDGLLNYAWTIICNAGNGDWSNETEEWQKAAENFREKYHKYLDEKKAELFWS